MAKKKRKNIQIYVYLGVSLLIFSFSYFILYPFVLDVGKQRENVLEAKEIFEQKKETVEKFSEVTAEYQVLSSETEKIDKIISHDCDLPRFLLQMEVLAENNGMIVENISFGASKNIKGLNAMPINIQILGSYASFKNYLGAVARGLPLIDVETISFDSKDKAEEIYSFSLSVNAYSKETPAISTEEKTEEEEKTEGEKEEEKKE